MKYSNSVVSKITDLDVVRPLVQKKMAYLKTLGEVFCDHKMEEIAAVTLVHKHYDINPDERTVWRTKGSRWIGKPEKISDSEIFPLSWKVGGGTDSNLYPLEFCPDRNHYTPEKCHSDQLLNNTRFLEEFSVVATELGVQDIFGIGLLQCRDTFVRSNMTMFEKSDSARRMMTSWLIPTPEVVNMSTDITLWDFKYETINGALGCVYGNSGCCCGI